MLLCASVSPLQSVCVLLWLGTNRLSLHVKENYLDVTWKETNRRNVMMVFNPHAPGFLRWPLKGRACWTPVPSPGDMNAKKQRHRPEISMPGASSKNWGFVYSKSEIKSIAWGGAQNSYWDQNNTIIGLRLMTSDGRWSTVVGGPGNSNEKNWWWLKVGQMPIAH